jgi:hypothetical protein
MDNLVNNMEERVHNAKNLKNQKDHSSKSKGMTFSA